MAVACTPGERAEPMCVRLARATPSLAAMPEAAEGDAEYEFGICKPETLLCAAVAGLQVAP